MLFAIVPCFAYILFLIRVLCCALVLQTWQLLKQTVKLAFVAVTEVL